MRPDNRLKEALVAYGRSLGLEVAVTDASPFPREEAVLRARRAAARESPFEAHDHTRRCDPEQILPGARSVICAVMPYLQPFPRPEGGGAGGPRGEISRYAWGEDYHHTLTEKLRLLAHFLEGAVPGAVCQVMADTGPLVERAAAARSGLGWVGKNGCLITPVHGSWVFLGEIVTTVALPPDQPLSEPGTFPGCGDCDLCLRTCPTEAFVAPGEIDFRRCLSYATQMKGPIPVELREAMGRRVWGCDSCQTVCPHNRPLLSAIKGEAAAAPDLVHARPPLFPLARVTKGEFKRTYGSTAAAWRGRHTLRRNALVAMGNSRSPEALPMLVRALDDPRPDIRLHAAWALGRYAASPAADRAHRALAAAAAAEEDADVLAEIRQALTAFAAAAPVGKLPEQCGDLSREEHT